MPELPDILAYRQAVEDRVRGRTLEAVRLGSPFVLRSVEPPIEAARGRKVLGVRRIGKRLVLQLEGDLFLVVHLMIAGRLHWRKRGAKIGGRVNLAAFDFEDGTLLLTEASKKKRASLHLVRGSAALSQFDRGGLEVLEADLPAFRATLARENRTLKRALTDPRLFSGIGNAYSDEILHAARFSPVKLTSRLSEEESERLFDARARDARALERALPRRGGPSLPGEGHRVSGGHGRARPVRQALPLLRIAGAADRLRRK